MKPFLADTLKRTARALVKLANLIDRPTIRLYDKQWNEVDKLPGWSRRIATTLAGSAPTLPRHG